MTTSVQISTSLPQVCLPSSHHIAVQPNVDPSPNSPVPSQLSGSDVVNIIIAISVLVGVVLGNPTNSKR